MLTDGHVFVAPMIVSAIRGGMVVTGDRDSDPRLLVAVLAADPLPAAHAATGK